MLNTANALTASRIVLVPLFLWLLLRLDGDEVASRWLALVVFVVAMVTDLVDGKIARRYNQVTNVGAIADPIADKLLIGGALMGLSSLNEVPWWMTIVILAREIGITLIRLVVVRTVVLPAGRGGKTKTTVQTIALILLISPLQLMGWDLAHNVGTGFLVAALVLTVVTGLDYLRTMWVAVRDAKAS